MFKRNKTDKGKTQANRLSDEAEPNVLAWDAAETEDAEDAEDPELEEDGDFEEDESEDEDPEVVARRQAELAAELQRQAEEYGLTSADPKAIYGPNGEAVASVLDALAELDMETAERLADAWDAVDPAERDVLERVMQRQHRGGEHEYELSAAEDSVAQWLAAQKPKGDEAVEVVRIVALAARDAVDAFVLDEILDDVDYDTLAGPWLEVMDADEADGEAEADTAIQISGVRTPSMSRVTIVCFIRRRRPRPRRCPRTSAAPAHRQRRPRARRAVRRPQVRGCRPARAPQRSPRAAG